MLRSEKRLCCFALLYLNIYFLGIGIAAAVVVSAIIIAIVVIVIVVLSRQ